MKTTEIGHAKITANFNQLISFATKHKAVYNPPNEKLQIAELIALHKQGQEAISKVAECTSKHKVEVSNRNKTFEPLGKLVTQIVNTLIIADAPEGTIKIAKSNARKLKGMRAKKINPNDTEKKHISVSQMSFDLRVANFKALIQLLEMVPEYKPNETYLQIPALTELHKQMIACNANVVNALSALGSARDQRNKLLYNPKEGMCHVALNIKKYVRLIFSTNSPEYKQIQKIYFKKR